MYANTPVDVPNLPGKITFRRKGRSVYVFVELKRTYQKDKQYNTVKRTSIGKLVSNDDRTKMYPNEHFTQKFPEVPVHDYAPPSKRSMCLKAGAFVVFESIVKEYGLDKLICKIFGDKGGLILDLACYMIVTEDNAGQHYPGYAREHLLFTPQMRVLSDSTVSRRFNEIREDQIISFLDLWNEPRDHRQKIYVSYDSTNKNCRAGDIDFAEYGHAKDDKGVPIVNYSVAYDKTNRVPLFYEQYPGSVNDVSELPYLIDKVKAYGYRSIGLILDRGYFSKNNIECMDQNKISFLMMVKGCKSLVSELILENQGSFERLYANKMTCRDNVHAKTIERRLYDGDSKTRYFHLCFDDDKRCAEARQLHQNIRDMADELKKLEGREYEPAAPYTQFFNCHYKEEKGKKFFLFAQVNHEAVDRANNLCGYFCLISSDKMTAEEAFTLYRGRDVSEKLFMADKSFLGNKSMRVHSDEALSAKTFTGFLALIIRNRFFNLLKDEMLRLNLNKKEMTVPSAIGELEKITMTRRNHSLYSIDFALTKTQKAILRSFGISPDGFIARAQAIAKQLNEQNDEIATNGDQEDEQS